MARPALRVWPPLPVGVYARRPAAQLPFPLGEPGVRVHSRARTALADGLRALGVGAGDRVLTPAWHHGSEVEAIRSTGAGCSYYDLGPDLAPREAELERLLAPNVRALHLTHYLGIPQDARRWREWCVAHDLLLIEDAAQGWLGSRDGVPLGSHGDLAVWCLYKIVGVPDGAAVTCRAALTEPAGPPVRAAGTVLRRHAAWVFQMLPGPPDRPSDDYDPEADMRLSRPRAASAATSRLLPRVVGAEVAERRREHYLVWLDALTGWTLPPWRSIGEGVVPMVFPVVVADKRAVLSALDRAGVHALDVWQAPHPDLGSERHPVSAWLRRHVVGLPVHQEMPARRLRAAVADVHGVVSRSAPPVAPFP